MLKAVKEHQSINSVSLQLASAVLDGSPATENDCSEEVLAARTLSRLRATLRSRGQTSAFCSQHGRISQATGWLSTSQHIGLNISINSKRMQINKVKRLTVAMHRICVRGIPRKIRSRSRGITAKIIPVTVIAAGFS